MPKIENHDQNLTKDASSLAAWYQSAKRDLPWRANSDPYRIWVSEVMLQQTTVAAVIPFFEKFLLRFPNLSALAKSSIEDVLEMWAGLGYYSRARNLHQAAQELAKNGFPQTYEKLLELPGFGPYTARAVSSLAFGERTGVLDGNVIRVLSRRYGLKLEWWKNQERENLQRLVDSLIQANKKLSSADLNQGLMELGATICTPQNPACLLCPWANVCLAKAKGMIDELPLPKPRKALEIWQWNANVSVKKPGYVLVVPNSYAPFLKGHWILPGSVEKLKRAPKDFDFRGGVTHHDIFVKVSAVKDHRKSGKQAKWVELNALKKEIPSSLIRKAIQLKLSQV